MLALFNQWRRQFSPAVLALGLGAALNGQAHAQGVSAYLPLGSSPELERLVERALILADIPVLTRPIPAATVRDALPAVCARDAALCEELRRRLGPFMRTAGLTHASLGLAAGSDEPSPMPNRRGMTSDSAYELSAGAFWQPGEHMLVSAGILAYEDETVPAGTVMSFGFEHAQLDLGFRERWLSPMTDSAMLLGTQAQTMPSVTLSSASPMTRLGVRYELFMAELGESDNIAFEGGFTAGNPRIAGMHVSFEPVTGWAIGFNRILQYGGGARSDSLSDLFDAFFRPSEVDNTGPGDDPDEEFGNQAASITSRFLVPGRVPFAVYFELAGEDTSKNSNVRLGNSALLGGLHFPRIGRFDLAFELGEWQNGWYVHHIYRDGLRHEGRVLGHWGADERVANDGVGARTLMARVGWQLRSGGTLEATYRTLENEPYSVFDYDRAHSLELRYSRALRDFDIGGEVYVSQDVFGESHSRVGAFLRF